MENSNIQVFFCCKVYIYLLYISIYIYIYIYIYMGTPSGEATLQFLELLPSFLLKNLVSSGAESFLYELAHLMKYVSVYESKDGGNN